MSEDELHAFVDDALDGLRRAEVAAYLEDHPDVAARVTAWRAQRQQLIAAFTGTLIRTYGSAFHQIPPDTRLTILPYRGEPDATDTVVRSTITREGGAPVAVDYRLEKTPRGWKIYDLNVEGIWLIQNYRNQFAQEIAARGIDGLIAALNQRNP